MIAVSAVVPSPQPGPTAAQPAAEVERPLSWPARVWEVAAVRQAVLIALLGLAWEGYGRWVSDPLLVPTLTEIAGDLWRHVASGTLPLRAGHSLKVLLIGYGLGVVVAGVLTSLAVSTRLGTDLLKCLTAMFNPLPAIALLPLALLWFGMGQPSLVFVLVHSVMWPMALNTHAGFLAVPETLRMAGHNYGLTGIRYVAAILIPAAFPSIVTGLKISWAFAWRTLIAAELVFGVAAGSGGIGWFIFENRNRLETASVFAGLISVVLIGLLVEGVVFRTIERRTVERWGMQR